MANAAARKTAAGETEYVIVPMGGVEEERVEGSKRSCGGEPSSAEKTAGNSRTTTEAETQPPVDSIRFTAGLIEKQRSKQKL